MAYRNFINIDDSLLDKPVYRIMSMQRVLEVLNKKQLSLVKPKKWDDPFENALLASPFEFESGERVNFSARDSVYGQCWTLHRETDAMWRIYSAQKDGVRVTSTPRKLLEALNKTEPEYSGVRCFIGQVTYMKKTALLDKLGKIHIVNTNGSGFAESLLYKRNEFRHEKEVRLIYSGRDGECKDDFYPFAIDPNDLIEKIMFDPRMEAVYVKENRKKIRAHGFSGPVTQSLLYRAPQGLVFKL